GEAGILVRAVSSNVLRSCKTAYLPVGSSPAPDTRKRNCSKSLSERQSVRQPNPCRSMLSARDFVVSGVAEYRKKSLMRCPESEGPEIAVSNGQQANCRRRISVTVSFAGKI